jgi:hypothetical protein
MFDAGDGRLYRAALPGWRGTWAKPLKFLKGLTGPEPGPNQDGRACAFPADKATIARNAAAAVTATFCFMTLSLSDRPAIPACYDLLDGRAEFFSESRSRTPDDFSDRAPFMRSTLGPDGARCKGSAAPDDA